MWSPSTIIGASVQTTPTAQATMHIIFPSRPILCFQSNPKYLVNQIRPSWILYNATSHVHCRVLWRWQLRFDVGRELRANRTQPRNSGKCHDEDVILSASHRTEKGWFCRLNLHVHNAIHCYGFDFFLFTGAVDGVISLHSYRWVVLQPPDIERKHFHTLR